LLSQLNPERCGEALAVDGSEAGRRMKLFKELQKMMQKLNSKLGKFFTMVAFIRNSNYE